MSYFTHCSNTRNDERIVALRMKLGAAGYGIYMMLVEKMSETTDCSLTCNYAVLAYDLHVGVARIQSVIEDFGLFGFTDDGTRFYCADLRRKMIDSESNMRPELPHTDIQIPQEMDPIESSDEIADEIADESADDDDDDCDLSEDNNDTTDDIEEVEDDTLKLHPESPSDNHHDAPVHDTWGYGKFLEDFLSPENAGTVANFAFMLHCSVERVRTLIVEVVTEWKITRPVYDDYNMICRHLFAQIQDKIYHPATTQGSGA